MNGVPSPAIRSVCPFRLVADDDLEQLDREVAMIDAEAGSTLFEEGDAALDVAADVIASGKTSRLYRTLVHERRLALDVSGGQQSRELEGFFQLAATAAPGRTLAEIEAVIHDALGELAATGPTDAELERALAQAEANFVYRLQTVGGFSGKSDQLNAYNVFLLRQYFLTIPRDLEEAGVVVSPGSMYGPSGEGFFRISLTTPDDRIAEAVERMRRHLA